MQDIIDEQDTKEKRDTLNTKMARAEARREKALRRKVKKVKKMAASGRMPSPEPGTSASGLQIADKGKTFLSVCLILFFFYIKKFVGMK